MTTTGYIGTYTKKEGKGVYRFELDEQTGSVTEVETGYELEASTYVNQHNSFLYTVTREGDNCGVASLKIEEDGKLSLINKCLASTKGSGCYVDVSPDGKFVFESVYGAGLARLYEANPETGEIIRLIQELEHNYPTGPHERQDQPHVHFISTTPDEKYVVAIDLGTDKIVTYEFNDHGFSEHAVSDFEPGDGPRHITFHENGKFAYVVHELSNVVSTVKYEDGEFTEIQRHSTIPENFEGDTKLAAVRQSHDQKFLYITNRGHDSIAIFKVSDDGSTISFVDIVSSGGEFPRDFNITDSDDFLVCAHQEGDYTLTVFKRDKITGELEKVDHHESAPEGVCVQFLK
ncbi:MULTISPECIES: 6-phosphogluconolactonase [Staphylococcus]|uniref:Beta-propeller fold lactonase family protein n=1 Tax=Staphylococcus equorum TaxID=246432 RepID=A0AAW7ALF9_9STAP|nr:beta-propeller fold lactonase family protein [Staphylococcus equorum]MDK9866440.1 beta-propeller fold lactonase family protein [Staphylococcus equorum]